MSVPTTPRLPSGPSCHGSGGVDTELDPTAGARPQCCGPGHRSPRRSTWHRQRGCSSDPAEVTQGAQALACVPHLSPDRGEGCLLGTPSHPQPQASSEGWDPVRPGSHFSAAVLCGSVLAEGDPRLRAAMVPPIIKLAWGCSRGTCRSQGAENLPLGGAPGCHLLPDTPWLQSPLCPVTGTQGPASHPSTHPQPAGSCGLAQGRLR